MAKKLEIIIENFKKLRETNNIECKLSKTSFPKEALKTYSSFANTDGGILILGLEEKENQFIAIGVEDSSKIKKEFFDALNNKTMVSKNILDDSKVIVQKIEGKEIVFIKIPRASYKDKPIFLYNSFNNSYKRNHEGDYKCSEEEIRKMIRDSSEESLDNSIVENFSIDDLDVATIKSYRQRFALLKPEHVFNTMTDEEFLKKLRILVKNRKSGELEPTIGGLLVFGKSESIKEALSHFHLEYIDKSSIVTERWRDRVIYDGTWGEGNLYNFFFTVIERLYSSLEKSFEMLSDKLTRRENSNVQIALREAFVNAIIHADFAIEEGIKITKYSNYFEFENPGQLRISKEDFFKGEHSKPRNHIIQEIFRHINLCERAGSGIPKILKVVKEEAYRYPEIEEKDEKFIFRFWNIGIIENMKNISKDEKIILEYLVKFGKINNKDARENLGLKKHELVEIFNALIKKDYLERCGVGRGIYYILKCSSEDEKRIRAIERINEEFERLKKQI